MNIYLKSSFGICAKYYSFDRSRRYNIPRILHKCQNLKGEKYAEKIPDMHINKSYKKTMSKFRRWKIRINFDTNTTLNVTPIVAKCFSPNYENYLTVNDDFRLYE